MNKFKEIRINNNLLQKDVALRLNKTITCICDWERERTEPSIDDLKKLADIYNCSIDYLVGRENDFGVIQTGNNLNEFQIELLSTFDMLNRDKQQQVIGFAKALNF